MIEAIRSYQLSGFFVAQDKAPRQDQLTIAVLLPDDFSLLFMRQIFGIHQYANLPIESNFEMDPD